MKTNAGKFVRDQEVDVSPYFRRSEEYEYTPLERQASVRVEPLSEEEVKAAETALENAILQLPAGICISGATCEFSRFGRVNGAYIRSDERTNGRFVYSKVGDVAWCMWYNPYGHWTVGQISFKNQNKANEPSICCSCYN